MTSNLRSIKAHLSMMVRRVFSDVSAKLGDLDFSLELLLEACVQHLALRWFEAVQDVRNGSNVVTLGEKDELSVDEVRIADSIALRLTVVQEGVLLDTVEPPLPILYLALGECHINEARSRSDDIIGFLIIHVIATDDIRAEIIEMNLVDVKV